MVQFGSLFNFFFHMYLSLFYSHFDLFIWAMHPIYDREIYFIVITSIAPRFQ